LDGRRNRRQAKQDEVLHTKKTDQIQFRNMETLYHFTNTRLTLIIKKNRMSALEDYVQYKNGL